MDRDYLLEGIIHLSIIVTRLSHITKKGSHDRLPAKPVLYLGLARLIPWGEYQDDSALKNSPFKLSKDVQSELSDLYAQITGIHANSFQAQNLRDIKKGRNFERKSMASTPIPYLAAKRTC